MIWYLVRYGIKEKTSLNEFPKKRRKKFLVCAIQKLRIDKGEKTYRFALRSGKVSKSAR